MLKDRLLLAYNVDNIEALADAIGVSLNTLYKWIGGESPREIPRKRLLEISEKTGRSVNWLLTGKEVEIQEPADPNAKTLLTAVAVKLNRRPRPLTQAELERSLKALDFALPDDNPGP